MKRRVMFTEKANENAGLAGAGKKPNDSGHLANIDIPPRTRGTPLRLIATKTNFPLTLFPPGNKEPSHSDFLAQVLLPRFFPLIPAQLFYFPKFCILSSAGGPHGRIH